MVWSQIIFDIVIIYLHRMAQLMMKQIGHKLGLYLTAWARGKNMAFGPLFPHLIRRSCGDSNHGLEGSQVIDVPLDYSL
jgi:hypothetical protein